MSDTDIIKPTVAEERDRGGRFVIGGKPGPGRPKGARSRFSEAFIEDLAAIWEERGIEVLQKCAEAEPGTFLKVCASLMPRDISLSVTHDGARLLTVSASAGAPR
jgi:hypothetical protein